MAPINLGAFTNLSMRYQKEYLLGQELAEQVSDGTLSIKTACSFAGKMERLGHKKESKFILKGLFETLLPGSY